MLFQMRFRTLFTLLLSLIAPAGSVSANMRFNFENCYKRSSFSCAFSLRKLTPMQEIGTHISSRRS